MNYQGPSAVQNTAALMNGVQSPGMDPSGLWPAVQPPQAALYPGQPQHSSMGAAFDGAMLFVSVYLIFKMLGVILLGILEFFGLVEHVEEESPRSTPPVPRPEHPLAKVRGSRPKPQAVASPTQPRRNEVYRPGEGWTTR